MSVYRKIEDRIWNDAKFRVLSDDGKLLFFLVMTHPHQTMLGAMRVASATLADDLGWPSERLSVAFAEVIAKGMVEYDKEARLLWLPNFLKYNRPESANVVKSWPTAFDRLPESVLNSLIYKACEVCAMGMSEAFQMAFERLRDAYAKRSGRLADTGTGTEAGAGTEKGDACATPAPCTPKTIAPTPVPTDADNDAALEPAMCAFKMFEEIGVIAVPRTMHAATQAITIMAKKLVCTPHAAMLLIKRRAEMTRAAGQPVNTFWFEDGKFEQDMQQEEGRNGADREHQPRGSQRIGQQLDELAKVRARRAARNAGDGPGEDGHAAGRGDGLDASGGVQQRPC